MYYPNVKMIKFKYMYGILHFFTYPPVTIYSTERF